MIILSAMLRRTGFELLAANQPTSVYIAVSNLDRVREGAYPMRYFWPGDGGVESSERLPESMQNNPRIDIELEGGTYEVVKMPGGVLLDVADFTADPDDVTDTVMGESFERRYWYKGLREVASTHTEPEGLPNA